MGIFPCHRCPRLTLEISGQFLWIILRQCVLLRYRNKIELNEVYESMQQVQPVQSEKGLVQVQTLVEHKKITLVNDDESSQELTGTDLTGLITAPLNARGTVLLLLNKNESGLKQNSQSSRAGFNET